LSRYRVAGDHAGVSDGGRVNPAIRRQLCLQAIAARQNGLVTFLQLRRIGVSRAGIDRLVQTGRLFRVHRGVYVVGRRELSREGEFHAAVFAIGDGAVLSHFPAAAAWGFWPGRVQPVDVTVARRVASRPGIRVHQVIELPERAVTTHLGIPVTTVERAILDLAATMYSDRHFRRLVHEAQVQRLTDTRLLQIEIDHARPRTRGVARLQAEIADGSKPTRSRLEDDVVELLRSNDFPPFETNAHVPGTPHWVEVDVLFESQRLVIEVDSDRYHGTPFRREFDARKQALIEAAGYRVIRLDEDALVPSRKAETVARIRHGLG
jgi:very-short-patch-repair endonuclease